VGLVRRGLDGANLSIVDAERALRISQQRQQPGVRFADAWLESTLLDSGQRLAPIFARVRGVGEENPELAATVRSFARNGFTLAGVAKEMMLHPNTVSYRLARWQELTGMNPKIFEDLQTSIVGLATRVPNEPENHEKTDANS
jgi:sugar diacid utilization regulator